MIEGSSVQAHRLNMMTLMKRLESLGVEVVAELQTGLLLQSLPPSFDTFVFNFNMHSMTTRHSELVNMLVQVECTMKKDKPIYLVSSPSSLKAPKAKTYKRKGNMNGSPKPNKMKAQGGVGKKNKDSKFNNTCHFCLKPGHWKRNCKDYLASSLKISGIYYVEVNLSVNDSPWILDSSCSSHICNHLQVMEETKMLSKGETVLRMGNGARVTASALGTV